MQTILGLKHSTLTRRIILTFFIIINLILLFVFETEYTLLNQINFITFGVFAFNENIILSLTIWITETLSLFSLFTSKNKYKLICSVILQIMCIADICFCIYYMIEQIEPIMCIIEIIIDLIFMGLILFDIVKTNKEKSDDELFNEMLTLKNGFSETETQGDGSSVYAQEQK